MSIELISKIPLISKTITERNLLTPSAGWHIWNSTTGQEEVYTGSAWVASLSLTGGTMTGAINFGNKGNSNNFEFFGDQDKEMREAILLEEVLVPVLVAVALER